MPAASGKLIACLILI